MEERLTVNDAFDAVVVSPPKTLSEAQAALEQLEALVRATKAAATTLSLVRQSGATTAVIEAAATAYNDALQAQAAAGASARAVDRAAQAVIDLRGN